MALNCQVCGDPDVPEVFVISHGNGTNTMSVCAKCRELSPRQMYELLQGRCDDLIVNLKAMASEAHRTGDGEGYAEAKKMLAFAERTKVEMWEPPL